MADIFISYARSTASKAQQIAGALRAVGYSVWIDDDLPAHRSYGRVIEEQIAAAKAAVVIWSADAVQSEWVLSEANRAREDRKLVQVTTDRARLPMPFDTIQCADLAGWTGLEAPGWRKVVASVTDLVGGASVRPTRLADTPLSLPDKPSVAVMPFANLSGDPEQDYFADGMVTEITTALSRIPSIFVIASGSTLSFKGKGVTPQDAGRLLGVRFVLEGSVRRSGARVRIAVQLTDAVKGGQIWAERFDDTLEDIFDLQDRVALAVAGRIEPTLLRAEIERVARRSTTDMGSYDLTMRAMPLIFAFTKDGILEARALLDRAIELDSRHGRALAACAFANSLILANRWSDAPESVRLRALDLARRSVDSAPDDPSSLPVVAEALVLAGESLDTARGLVDRAIALNPGNSFAWFSSGWMAVCAGEADVGAERLETSIRLDPLSMVRAFQLAFLGQARFNQRRLVEAESLLEQAFQLNPSHPAATVILPACYGHLGKLRIAHTALERLTQSGNPSVAEFTALYFRDPAQRQFYLDGIALAKGGTQS